MAAELRGSTYTTRHGVGIRWLEDGKRRHQSGFRNKSEARRWFTDNVAPRLRGPARPTRASRSTRSAMCSSSGTARPCRRRRKRRWRNGSSRRARCSARGRCGRLRAPLRMSPLGERRSPRHPDTADVGAAAGAQRGRAVALHHPQPGGRGRPEPAAEGGGAAPVRARADRRVRVGAGPVFGPVVVFAAESGLRPEEWIALERRDLDRAGRAVTVQRKYANGRLSRTRRRTGHGGGRRSPHGRSRLSSRSRRGWTRRCCSRPRRAATSVSTPGGHASGTRRSRPRRSSSEARMRCVTRSPRRLLPRGCRRSSCRG
jgi:hypothetical protein